MQITGNVDKDFARGELIREFDKFNDLIEASRGAWSDEVNRQFDIMQATEERAVEAGLSRSEIVEALALEK